MLHKLVKSCLWYIICVVFIINILLMYSLLNVGRLYLVMGFISILVYFNIPDEMNKSTMATWILGLSLIYFVLGIIRLVKYNKNNSQN